MKTQKCVDVIIPTYNSANYLKIAIESVESQREWIKKIIVVDDGSTDNTKIITNQLIKKYKNIKYIRQKNLGPSSARNAGIKMSKSKYIALLDADDVWLPHKLSKQLQIFEKTKWKDLGVVYGKYYDIDGEGNSLPNFSSLKLEERIRGDVYSEVVERNCISGSDSAVLIKRECFKKCGLFDENLQACEDWDMWVRIAKKYKFDYVNDSIIAIRRHHQEIQRDTKKMLFSTISFLQKKQKLGLNISKEETKNIRVQIIRFIIKHPLESLKNRKILFNFLKISINNSASLLKDFCDALYAEFKLFRFMYLFIENHVIPPIRTYIFKPIKKLMNNYDHDTY